MTPPPGYILIRPETLVGVQKAMEAALGARAAECLAAGGRVGGAAATAALEGDAPTRARRLLSAGFEIGWGEFALERLTADALVVTVAGSPFARAYGAAAAPVCHLTRGVLEALASVVLDRPAPITETACAAMGADRCRFESIDDGGDEASPPSPPRFARGQAPSPPFPPRFARGQSSVRA